MDTRQHAHLLIDAGATKTTFALLDGTREPFRCQGAGINANYTPVTHWRVGARPSSVSSAPARPPVTMTDGR